MTTNLQDTGLFRDGEAYWGGAWRKGESFLEVDNPATGEIIGQVPELSSEQTREAIDFAEQAYRKWSAVPAPERAKILHRWFELTLEHLEDLALILTTEQGKPLAEAQAEIRYGASYIEWFAEEAKRIDGDIIPAPSADRRIIVLKQPVGVCAAITPWNFPNAMLARKVAPALAAGCSILVKPASQTPFSALALAELALRAGLPHGLFSVLTGQARVVGTALVDSPVVRKLTFTGSTEVGKILLRGSAETVKKVTMELGGNAPFLVFADADLDAAVEGILASKFRNSGQTCVCANRILVEESIRPALLEKLLVAVKNLRLGNGVEEGVTQGPLIDKTAREKVHEFVTDALSQGAELHHGGMAPEQPGFFYHPTILDRCHPGMQLAREEIFGPVAPLFSFSTEEEAIELANATEVGLAAYFYSRDIGRIWRVAEALEVGMVGINTGVISNAMAPFGGIKESGLGREGSKYGIGEFLNLKYLCLAGLGQ
jgi:succinate-semialdehyde dehydrogenase/glutarate-semialdehyde dehydrogenase